MTRSQRTVRFLSVCLAGLLVAPAFAAPEAVSPLRVDAERISQAGGSQAAVPLEFDAEAYAALRGRSAVRLDGFPVAPAARGQQMMEVTLDLQRMKSISERTQFVVASVVDGQIVEQPMAQPDVTLFRGKVEGDDSSYAFLALSPHGTHGYIRTGGVTQVISPGPFGEDRTLLIYNMDALPRGAIRWRDFVCHTQTHDGVPWPALSSGDGEGGEGGEGGVAGPALGGGSPEPPCRRVTVAIETDKEFTDNLFGGDESASGAYVATLLAASSEIFERDVNVEIEVGFVRLWTGSDPWTAGSTSGQLFEFRDHWQANMTHIERHLAHYLSGRTLGGGIAFLDGVCTFNASYALSANLNGFFPYPLQDNSSQNWDIVVVTHELGHNFGTVHTHNYCPPLDQCAPSNHFGACQDEQICQSGTLMSYCHTCSGGISNFLLEFHPVVIQTMLDYLDTVTNCYLGCVEQTDVVFVPQDTPSIQEAISAVLPGGQVVVDPGTYFETVNPNGKPVHILSTGGPEVTIIDATDLGGSVARFSNGETSQTILEGFTLTGGTGTNVTIGSSSNVLGGGIYAAGSSPMIINCIISGNTAQFGGGMFNNNASPVVQDTIFSSNTADPSSGGGVFNFSGAAPHFINVQFSGNYAVANGGAMSNQSATPIITSSVFLDNAAAGSGGAVRNIQGSAGQFIDCAFEGNSAGDTGGAFINDSSAGTAISDSLFCENTPNHITGGFTDAGGNDLKDSCAVPGDLDGNGVVDVFDLMILLGAWGLCGDPADCPADLNGDGAVDVMDLLLLLGMWG